VEKEKRIAIASIDGVIEVLKGYRARIEKCEYRRCVENEIRSLIEYLMKFCEEAENMFR